MHLHPRLTHHARRTQRHFQVALLVIPLALMALYIGYRITAKPIQNKPLNVILISIDSLRSDHMGVYGYARNTTPNIDAWAKDAVVFKNFFSTSFLTPISEASVHTGKYPFSSGVVNFQTPVPEEMPTLAKILKQRGYQTAAFGTSPEFIAYPSGKSLSLGFDEFNIPVNPEITTSGGRSGDPFAMALPWIKKITTQDSGPFFLWLPVGSVHWPYGLGEPEHFSKPGYQGFFKDISKLDLFHLVGFAYKNHTFTRATSTGAVYPGKDISDKDYNYVIDRYDDGIVRTDRLFAGLANYLKASGLDKNTIVILQSEHGEGLGERGYVLHYDIYDEQVHMPLIIKAPNLIAEQRADLASGVDILPTTLALLGTSSSSTDGVSLFAPASSTQATSRKEVFITRTPLWERVIGDMGYWELAGFIDSDNTKHFHDTAIRTKQWKLIHRLSQEAQDKWGWLNVLSKNSAANPEYELYDIEKDIHETNNIYQKLMNDSSIITLRERLTLWEAEQSHSAVKPTPKQEIQPYF